MADIRWFQITSWHAVGLSSDRVGRTRALCGKAKFNAIIVDKLGAGRSCENCLRILGRREDTAPA